MAAAGWGAYQDENGEGGRHLGELALQIFESEVFGDVEDEDGPVCAC